MGAKYTPEESQKIYRIAKHLRGLLNYGKKTCPSVWKSVARDTNNEFHNNRTPDAVENEYYKEREYQERLDKDMRHKEGVISLINIPVVADRFWWGYTCGCAVISVAYVAYNVYPLFFGG